MLSNTNKMKKSKITKKVVVVLPDGKPFHDGDYVPPEIAQEIRDRHEHPEKYIRPSLNEILRPSDEEIQRRKNKLQEFAAKKRIENEQKRRIAEETKAKIEKHLNEVLESVSSVINLDDVDLVE